PRQRLVDVAAVGVAVGHQRVDRGRVAEEIETRLDPFVEHRVRAHLNPGDEGRGGGAGGRTRLPLKRRRPPVRDADRSGNGGETTQEVAAVRHDRDIINPSLSRQKRRVTPTVICVRARVPPLNTSKPLSGAPLNDDTRPVAGSLLNWIAGLVNDSTKPLAVPEARTKVGDASTSTRAGSGPIRTRASMRSPHRSEKSCSTPPPATATKEVPLR